MSLIEVSIFGSLYQLTVTPPPPYSDPDCAGDLDLDLPEPEADLLGEPGDWFLEEAAEPERDRRDAGEPDLDLEFARDCGVAERERPLPEAFDPERDRRGDDGALDPDLDRDREPDLDLERDLDLEAAERDRDLEPPERDCDLDLLRDRSFPDPFSFSDSESEPILLRLLDVPSLSLPLAILSLSSSLSSDDETNRCETTFLLCFWDNFSSFDFFSFFFRESPFSFLCRSRGFRSFFDFLLRSLSSLLDLFSPPSASLPDSDNISPSSLPLRDLPDAEIFKIK